MGKQGLHQVLRDIRTLGELGALSSRPGLEIECSGTPSRYGRASGSVQSLVCTEDRNRAYAGQSELFYCGVRQPYPSANGSTIMFSNTMKPRISVLTLGVADLEESLAFYRDGLGLTTEEWAAASSNTAPLPSSNSPVG